MKVSLRGGKQRSFREFVWNQKNLKKPKWDLWRKGTMLVSGEKENAQIYVKGVKFVFPIISFHLKH